MRGMKTILVANLGSTSLKFKLFGIGAGASEVLAAGGAERIGQAGSRWYLKHPAVQEASVELADHATALETALEAMRGCGVLSGVADLGAVAFKAVHGGPISGAVRVDEHVLETMRAFADVAPAHNPMYLQAMTGFAARAPSVPQIACFETAFHQTMPPERSTYAIAWDWTVRLGVRRYGFHGASHRYIAGRALALLGQPDARVISCHLGGSSSVCAIAGGRSVANSFGISAQSGLPHNNRVGDLDCFALLKLRSGGLSDAQIWEGLSRQGGLLGISGVSNDLRDIEQVAATAGHPLQERAELAIGVLVMAVSDYIGAYLMQLGGADAIVLTGGIGENSRRVQGAILSRLGWLGVTACAAGEEGAGWSAVPLLPGERRMSGAGSRPWVLVVPTDEEQVLARQAFDVLEGG